MRRLFYFGMICFVGVMSAGVIYSAPAYKDGDWQLWNDEALKASINDKFGIFAEQEFRWGDGMRQYYYEHSHIQLDFKTLNWLTISPAIREIYEINSKEAWYWESEPQINITGSWKVFNDWSFDARARIEYRIFEEPGKNDVWRNRDKFTLKSPWKLSPLKLNPYIADEIFFQEKKDGIYENRLWLGMGMQFCKNIKGDLYCMLKLEDKNGDWWSTNVLGVQLKFEF